MNQEIADPVTHLLRDKGITKEEFEDIIHSIFQAIIKKKYDRTDNFTIIFNPDRGDLEILCKKVVVPDGEVTDPVTEIGLGEAQKADPYAEIEEEVSVTLDPKEEFSRRLIASLRQHLRQRIREIERQNLYNEFIARKGELIIGSVHQITRYDIRIMYDKTELIMPRNEQIPSERYRRGETIKAIVLDVEYDEKESSDPKIIVSRRHTSFVRKIFELEVPEIAEGIVEIRRIAREAGERTKIAVISNDKRIDPVGACVGMKGSRISAVVKEIHRIAPEDKGVKRDRQEKIDIVPWTDDDETMIRRALAPVIPLDIVFLEGGNKVLVIIPDDKMAQAVGRRGQNIRLASHLTGFDLEPIKSSEYYYQEEELSLEEVEGLQTEWRDVLMEVGYNTAEEVLSDGAEEVQKLTQLDSDAVAKIMELLGEYFEESE